MIHCSISTHIKPITSNNASIFTNCYHNSIKVPSPIFWLPSSVKFETTMKTHETSPNNSSLEYIPSLLTKQISHAIQPYDPQVSHYPNSSSLITIYNPDLPSYEKDPILSSQISLSIMFSVN